MKWPWRRAVSVLMAFCVLFGTVTQGDSISYAARQESLASLLETFSEEGMPDGPVLDDTKAGGLEAFMDWLRSENSSGRLTDSNASASNASSSNAEGAGIKSGLLEWLDNLGAALTAPLGFLMLRNAKLPAPELKSSGLFRYYEEDDAVVITGFAEGKGRADLPDGETLEIPDTLEGKPVKRVDPMAFYQEDLDGLGLVLGANVEEIGESAFAGSGLKTLTFGDAVKKVQASAFRDNKLEELQLNQITELAEEAFLNNKLKTLSVGDALSVVGDSAFSYNDLDVVQLPAGITAWGTGVFTNNNRYVLVETGSPVLRTEVVAEQYGQVVNPATITVRCVDEASGQPILGDMIFGNDREKLDGLVFLNEENTYKAPPVHGFEPVEPELKYTPDSESYVLTVKYKNTHILPVIEPKASPFIPLNGDGGKAALLAFVKATDLNGEDISASVTVSPESIPTDVSGQIIPVSYSVRDRYGNAGSLTLKVSIGVDWNAFPIGKGWTLGDFTYDGNKVTGFSESGLLKVETQKELVLPHLNPADGTTVIDTVAENRGENSFRVRGLTALSDYLSTAEGEAGNIRVIEGEYRQSVSDYPGSFSSNAISELRLNALEIAGGKAFEENALTHIRLPRLTLVQGKAFSTNKLEQIGKEDLPLLEKIETMGFVSNESLSSISLPSLKETGYVSFWNCPIAAVEVPNLEIVGDGAFLDSKLTEVTEENFPALRIVEDRAFNRSPLTRVSIPMVQELLGQAFYGNASTGQPVIEDRFDSLEQLGDEALRGNGALTELHMPKLKRIGTGAFAGNPGSPEWANRVVIYTDNESLPSKENYIVNPSPTGDGDWEEADFTWDAEHPEVVTGFSATGQDKIAKKNFELKLPPRAQVVAEGAFEAIGLVSVSAPNVTEVRDSGFYGNKLSDISSGFPQLRSITGTWAFGVNKITALDLPQLESIGRRTFSGNPITEAELPAVRDIGDYAFAGAPLETLHAPQLERIGKRAFYSHKLEELSLPALREVGVAAFADIMKNSAYAERYDYPDENITGYYNRPLEKLYAPSLESVAPLAFAGNKINELEAPALRTVGRRAFDENQIRELSLPELRTAERMAFHKNQISGSLDLPKAETLSELAFGYNRLDEVFVSAALKELSQNSFQGNRNSNKTKKEVLVFVMDGNKPAGNPNELEDGYVNQVRQHLINPTHVTVKYLDENDKQLADTVSEYIYGDKTYSYIRIFQHSVDHETVEVPDDRQPHELIFRYQKQTVTNRGGVELRQGNETDVNSSLPKHSYHIGELMTTWVYLDVTDDDNTYTEGEIRLYYDPKYIDQSSIKVRKEGTSVKSFEAKDGELRIQLATDGSVSGGYSLSLPVEWRFKKYETPNHHGLQIQGLFTNKGESICVAEPLTLEGYYNPPQVIKRSPLNLPDYDYKNLDSSDNGPRLMGVLGEYLKPDGVREYKVTEAMPVRYDFTVGSLERYVDQAIVRDTLPQYVAINADGLEETRDAVFDQSMNPDWSLSVDAEGKKLLSQSRQFPKTLNPSGYIAPLYLSYPDLKSGYNVENQVQLELVPHDIGAKEEHMQSSDDLSIYTGFYAPIVYDGDPRFEKFPGGGPHTDGITSYFYDTAKDREKVIPFLLRASSLAQKSDLQELVIADYDLDPRLYYYGVSFPRDSHTAANITVDVIAYKRAGKNLDPASDQILDQQSVEMSERNHVVFPEEIAREIDYVYLVLPAEHKLMSALEFRIDTKLREPDKKQYNASSSGSNVFQNYAVMSGNLYIKGTKILSGERGDLKKPDGNTMISKYHSEWDPIPGNFIWGDHAEIYVRDYAQRMGIQKTQSYPSTAARPIYPGERGDYVLSLKPEIYGGAAIADLGAEDLKNFEMIDLMPNGVSLNQIQLSEGFQRSGGEYELIENYGGTDQLAIRFHTELLKAGVYHIATLKTATSPAIPEGFVTNRLYVDFENPSIMKLGVKKAVPGKDASKPWLYDETSFRFMKAKEMYARKYIRRYGELPWSDDGVMTESEGQLEYKLELINNQSSDRENVQLMDFFPYVGDTNIQEENIGNHKRAPRNSEFENQFDLSRSVQVPEGYEVLYWNSDTAVNYNNRSADQIAKELSWAAAPAANTRGILVKAKPGVKLAAGGVLAVIVPMKAPKNDLSNNYANTGKKAWNSFVRKDSATIRFIEPNAVWNSLIPPKGSISFKKFGKEGIATGDEKAQGLPGAEFEAKDSKGHIYTAVSGEDGEVRFTDLPIQESYTITETKLPEGYQRAENGAKHELKLGYEDFKKHAAADAEGREFHVRIEDTLAIREFMNVKPYRGSLELLKVNEAGTPLPYVAFRLKGMSPWNQDYDRSFRTGTDGKIKVSDLLEGVYQLTEQTNSSQTAYQAAAPLEFAIDAEHREIRFTGDQSIVNKDLQLVINKLGLAADAALPESLQKLTNFGKKRLDGYAFSIQELTADGQAVGAPIETGKTVRGAVIVKNLKLNTLYEISELPHSDPNYRHNDKKYRFKLNDKAEITDESGQVFRQNILNFPNLRKPVRGLVEVEKQDERGAALAGAVFALYRNGAVIQKQEAKLEGNRALARFENIEPGIYYLRELTAPDGYLLSDTEHTVYIPFEPGGDKKGIIVEEEQITKKFSFRYVDRPLQLELIKGDLIYENILESEKESFLRENSAYRYRSVSEHRGDIYLPLRGAEFALYEKLEDGSRRELTPGKRFISDAEGRIELGDYVKQLNVSRNYILVETKAPEGYRLDSYTVPEIPLNFRDDSRMGKLDGSVIRRFKNNQPIAGRILISKRDADTRSALKGAEFALYLAEELQKHPERPEPLLTVTSNARGIAEFRNLSLGSYVVREVKAPEGYQRMEKDYHFELTEADSTGSIIINNPHLVEFGIEKQWIGKAAREAVVEILCDGVPAKDINGRELPAITLSAKNRWSAHVEGLPAMDASGRRYQYSLRERPIEGYEVKITGSADYGEQHFKVTNMEIPPTPPTPPTPPKPPTPSTPSNPGGGGGGHTPNPGKKNFSVKVQKLWEGSPLDAVTVYLLRDGESYARAELSASEGWSWEFRDLPVRAEGSLRKYRYTIAEEPCEGYETSISGDAGRGFTVTNTEIPEQPETPGSTPERGRRRVPKTGEERSLTHIALLGLLLLMLLGLHRRKENQD